MPPPPDAFPTSTTESGRLDEKTLASTTVRRGADLLALGGVTIGDGGIPSFGRPIRFFDGGATGGSEEHDDSRFVASNSLCCSSLLSLSPPSYAIFNAAARTSAARSSSFVRSPGREASDILRIGQEQLRVSEGSRFYPPSVSPSPC
jgi:hypothetical protein